MDRVTPKQKAVYDFIESSIARMGYSPSYEEIAAGVGLSSVATVHKHIQAMRRRGFLTLARNSTRSIQLKGMASANRCERCVDLVRPAATLMDEIESGDLTISQARVLARKFAEAQRLHA